MSSERAPDDPDAQRPERDHPGKDGISIADPEDYNRTRRLRQIHDAKERVTKTIREEGDKVSSDPRNGGITRGRYREKVKDALIDYLIEVEPLMLNEKIDGEDVWNETEVEEDPEGDPITLERIVEENGYVPGESEDSVPLPINVSRKAWRPATRFLTNQVGFGLELDEGLPTDKL